MTNLPPIENIESNQGEGDRRSAKRYNREATRHARSGATSAAASEAIAAIDAAPEAHAEAERAGKARTAELDPAVTMPAWWAVRDETAWERIKGAFRRDWEQTKSDLSLGHAGETLDQNLIDTLRQMAGSDPLPIEGEPTGVDHEIDTAAASRAFELGYNAAIHFNGEWTPTIESRLRAEWDNMTPHVGYKPHRRYIYLGWRHQRRFDEAAPTR